MMLERILVPLDGSPTAEGVLPQVGRLLKLADAEVILVQALDVPASLNAEYAAFLPEWRQRTKKYLESMQRHLADRGVRARAVLREEASADGILNAATDEKATLIAMSSHGRTGLARFVLGSVAEKVLRQSRVPVLLVRSFQPGPEGAPVPVPAAERPFKKIVVPVDGSPTSGEVIPAVLDLARRTGAKVILVNVSDWVFHYRAPARPPNDPAVDAQFATAEKLFQGAGLECLCLKLRGDAASILVDFCEDHQADLLAMGTHGRRGVTRWALGSVTEKVLRGASLPLLVVRGSKSSSLVV